MAILAGATQEYTRT